MRQGLKPLALCAALAVATAWSLAAPVAPPASAASSSAAKGDAKPRNGMHQFTGVVTALDQSSLTVEKSGKKPRTVVFAKHSEMKVTGDLEKSARVTVYYRDDGGRSVAHRVVVKPAPARTTKSR
jgi:protein gp37